jgi:hypothetical protein
MTSADHLIYSGLRQPVTIYSEALGQTSRASPKLAVNWLNDHRFADIRNTVFETLMAQQYSDEKTKPPNKCCSQVLLNPQTPFASIS